MATDMTGPVSKDTHTPDKTFTPKIKASVPGMKGLTNNLEQARSAIMGIRYPSNGTSFGTNIESAMKRKPSA